MSTANCWDQHDAMKRDASRWSSLALVGHMETEDDAGRPCLIEMRNCASCHSTLGVYVPKTETR